MYDYLIVGAGLSGQFLPMRQLSVVKSKVIDKRDHIGGNIYCEEVEGINVHKYGAHIFHTSNKKCGTMSTSSLNSTTISTHQ